MKFDELEKLFESSTIKPSFDYIHAILALYLFAELGEQEGIGRYRLKEELLIGSGTAKSLISKLNTKVNFIRVLSRNNQKKGHILTNSGFTFLSKIKQKIPVLKEGDLSVLKDIIIKIENMKSFFCLIRNGAKNLTNGVKQRDAAIKIDGSGATCLVYNGNRLIFPPKAFSESEIDSIEISENVQEYFNVQLSENELEKNDVIIIGLGESAAKARLAALNAALTLI